MSSPECSYGKAPSGRLASPDLQQIVDGKRLLELGIEDGGSRFVKTSGELDKTLTLSGRGN